MSKYYVLILWVVWNQKNTLGLNFDPMFLDLAHTHLSIFKASKTAILITYKLTTAFPQDEKFALTQQIRRAVVSVHLNIAEGCSRKSSAERKRFFEISRGSLIEVDTAFDLAIDLLYIKKEDAIILSECLLNCYRMLSKMISA